MPPIKTMSCNSLCVYKIETILYMLFYIFIFQVTCHGKFFMTLGPLKKS